MTWEAPVHPKTRLTSFGILGLIAIAIMTAMACLSATAAMAETTALCKKDESPCAGGSGITHLHEETLSGAKAKVLSSLGTVECAVLFLGDALSAGAPLVIHGHFTYTECKLGAESCELKEVSSDSLLNVLKEGPETAKVTLSGEVKLKCGFVSCNYNGEGIAATAKGPLSASFENGEITTKEQELHKVSGFFCPEKAKLDFALMPLEKTYIAKGGGGESSKKSTSITTSLKDGSKEGAEITVTEGSKVKDTATLSGENASKAGGTVKYKVYKDKECKELATSAGEVTVKEGKVPDSEEKELEAGAVYYWQAEYSGDSSNEPSTSTCSKEVLTVKAKTTLATKLSGGGKEGEEITVAEGSKVKDQATLSGTKSSTAKGTVKYAAYKDKECKELATKAGEGEVKEGKAPASEEKELEAGAVYYWQAEYGGDSLHEASTSTCSKEVLTVKAKTSLSTSLAGEEPLGEEPVEGEEITVAAGATVVDSASLSGTNSAKATGTIKYAVYSDAKCEKLVTEAGELAVAEGSVPASDEEVLEEGVFYWQATYSGDSLHEATTSPCSEIATVMAATSLVTSLSGEGEEGGELVVAEGSPVTDEATLSGPNASKATGTIEYFVYGDPECTELVTEAGEASVAGESVSSSAPETLEPGVYQWQAVYSGDGANHASVSSCGAATEIVRPPLTSELSGGGETGPAIEVTEGTLVSDQAALHGENSAKATGTIDYTVYSDSKCEEPAVEAGGGTIEEGNVPASEEVGLEPGTYYWQAEYSGDISNPPATAICGAEIVYVVTPTSLTMSLAGEGKEGEEIEVREGAAVTAQASLSGAHAGTAGGFLKYEVFSDNKCTELVLAGDVEVEEGTIPPLSEEVLPPGTYYWQAVFTGDGLNQGATSVCGAAKEVVTAPITTILTSGEQSGKTVEVAEGALISDQATLHGPNASKATGTITYDVYADEDCEELVAKAGEVKVEGTSIPPSEEEELEAGAIYYWQAAYSGDESNPPATSPCGVEQAVVGLGGPPTMYAALGDSFSAGQSVSDNYYPRTNQWIVRWVRATNICHRSRRAWPPRVAEAMGFGEASTAAVNVFQQQPGQFIFRACSGAGTQNIWGTESAGGGAGQPQGGQYDEFIEAGGGNPAARWLSTPAQDLWLRAASAGEPPGANLHPNRDIALVTLSIGGNDSGFATIAENCIGGRFFYSRNTCREVIAEWRSGVRGTAGTLTIPSAREGIPSIDRKLPTILNNINRLAPRAKIRVVLYPQVLDTSILRRINLGYGYFLDNDFVGPRGVTIAVEMEELITDLNAQIQRTVTNWGTTHQGIDVNVVQTANAFLGNQLGNADPWVFGIVLPFWPEESLHPTCRGHIALAEAVLRNLGRAVPMMAC
jgi:hypothetical protein